MTYSINLTEGIRYIYTLVPESYYVRKIISHDSSL